MAIDQKLINEINALAHKKKTVGLTGRTGSSAEA